jgi:DNA/RNA endonuclease YhcR with UshA esterase domain
MGLRFASIVVLAMLSTPTWAAPISAADAAGMVGQTVTVNATVSEVKHFAKSGITLLDLDGRYPRQALTLFISGADADKFPDAQNLEGATVEASGIVSEYHGRPEIALSDPTQFLRK